MNNTKNLNKSFCWTRTNYRLMAMAFLCVVLGFVLMTGPACSLEKFEPDVFSFRRTVVAPSLCFLGYVLMIPGILYKK